MIRILIIEDDKNIQAIFREVFANSEYVCDFAENGVDGITLFNKKKDDYTLIIVDLLLPGIDGYGICEYIRNTSAVPLIVCSALDDEEHQLKAFNLRIDDYITKPFSVSLFKQRVEAVLRRYIGDLVPISDVGNKHVINWLDFSLDLSSYIATYKGKSVELTQKEVGILQLLIEHNGAVLSRDEIIQSVWGYQFSSGRLVDNHIKNIRQKLDLPYIKSVSGVGYCLGNKTFK